MNDVGSFFNRVAEEYFDRPAGLHHIHRITARRIEKGVSGRILSVGGLWVGADPQRLEGELVLGDVSEAMLAKWAHTGARLVRCDARALPFEPDSFDNVVLPLVLHHITQSSGRTARASVRQVFREVGRVLQPGGAVWISDFSVPGLVYGAELALAPLTRRLLGLAGIPLVIMHWARFYRRALGEAGFRDVDIEKIRAPTSALHLVRPVIGVPWLVWPWALYPIRPVLITARA